MGKERKEPVADWRLRDSQPADFETLYEIDRACYPPGVAYTRRMLRWFLRLPDAECVVAERAAEIVGFILAEHEAGEGHIITLDVLEAHRRRGIGSALLAEIERRLAARGVERVELETATDNAAAVAFWQNHGYRTFAILKRYYLGRVDAFAMQKSLRTADPAAAE